MNPNEEKVIVKFTNTNDYRSGPVLYLKKLDEIKKRKRNNQSYVSTLSYKKDRFQVYMIYFEIEMQKRKLKRFLTSKSAENYCEKQFALLWGKEECCSDDGKYSFIQGPFVCNGDFNEYYHPNGERSMIRVGIDEEPNKKLKEIAKELGDNDTYLVIIGKNYLKSHSIDPNCVW